MRSVLALLRASWLTATSYRLATVLSLAGLLASVIPIYFIAGALQPMVQESIRAEGGEYFGFLLLGIAATYVLASAVTALPATIAGSLGSGTFESLLVTRTPLPLILGGMAAYPLVQSLVRAALLVVGAQVVGVEIAWRALPLALVVVALLIAAYGGLSLVAAALILAFRTAGPLTTAVIAGSGLLGGVYYSTASIPAWLQSLSAVVPLTYGLRAIRMLLLAQAATGSVTSDIAILAVMSGVSLAGGGLLFGFALRYARRAGTLSQY